MLVEPRAGNPEHGPKKTGLRPISANLRNLHKIVGPRARDFFDPLCFSHPSPDVLKPQHSRHRACPGLPWERSASHICRITKALWREVEGPRRCLLADAVRSFPATSLKSHNL